MFIHVAFSCRNLLLWMLSIMQCGLQKCTALKGKALNAVWAKLGIRSVAPHGNTNTKVVEQKMLVDETDIKREKEIITVQVFIWFEWLKHHTSACRGPESAKIKNTKSLCYLIHSAEAVWKVVQHPLLLGLKSWQQVQFCVPNVQLRQTCKKNWLCSGLISRRKKILMRLIHQQAVVQKVPRHHLL